SAPGIAAATRGQLAADLSVAALEGLTHGEAIAAVAGVVAGGGLPRVMRGPLLFNLGSLLHQAGDASASHRHIAGAVPHLADQPGLRALAMSALASPWVVEGRLDEHLGWIEEAGRAAAEYGNEVVIRAVRANRAAVLSAVGDPAAARSEPEPPPAGARDDERIDWVRSCTNLAVSACYVGGYEASRRWTALGIRESESLGYDRFTSPLLAVDLLLRWLTGDWEALAADAAALEEGAMDVPSAVQASVVRGLVDLASGEIADVDPRLADAMDRSARCGAIPTMGMAAAGLARLHLARGEAGAARAVALRALGTAAGKGIWAWALDAAPAAVEALVACGAEEEARDWTEQLERGLAGRAAPAAAAAVATCHALLADDEGPARFSHAHQAWAALPRPYEAALAGERRGRQLIRRDADAGGAALLAALDAFRGLGAEWDDGRVRRELRRHHVALPYAARRRRRDYDDVLSAREREVVELVASGLSSTRIAQRLHLSARTVDHHVERALRKLGVPSRRELVAARQAATDGPGRPGSPH
ncbi:MAG: LuxR C-terminal-related transcriptional regulator, partial [Acidimicrobiales bacterium]